MRVRACVCACVCVCVITDKKEVAEVLAKNLSNYSSTDNYSDEFQRIKTLKEKRRLDFSSKIEEEYNLPFSVTELRQSIRPLVWTKSTTNF